MKIAFFGTPEHSAKLFQSLLETQGIEVLFAVTNPDRPKGRSKTPVFSPVKQAALEKGLPVFQFESIKKEKDKALEEFARYPAELYLVFAYGSILPKEVFEFPRFGTINLHGSLLPDLRGASPVQTALWKGYDKTGISIQYIGEKMDEGDIIQEAEIPISLQDNTGTLMDRITELGTEHLGKLLAGPRTSPFVSRPQDPSLATYCTKIKPEDRILDFKISAREVHDRIRALAPEPGAVCRFRDKRFVLHQTRWTGEREDRVLPGKLKRMDRKTLLFQCGDGLFLEILSLQPENKNRMSASDFLNGFRITEEDRFE